MAWANFFGHGTVADGPIYIYTRYALGPTFGSALDLAVYKFVQRSGGN